MEGKRGSECLLKSVSNIDFNPYIVQHKFKESDLPELISSYANVNTKLQQAIYDRALENINIIIENEYVVDKALLVRLLLDEQTENKKLLFAVNVEMMTFNELLVFIKKLDFPIEFINVLKGKRPKFEVNKINKLILDTYLDRNYINRIHEEDGEYRVYGKRIL